MQKQPCQTLPGWLKTNLGSRCLAPLTGTDAKALAAAVQIIALYAYAPHEDVLRSFRGVVLQMQESTRYLAYHAIAHVMDWNDRPRVWTQAGLPQLAAGRCKFE